MKNRLQTEQTETEPSDSLYMAKNEMELREILKQHPDGEMFAVITHKVKGTARIFGWVDGKPKPLSPVFPNAKIALLTLKTFAQIATDLGITSLIEQIEKGNEVYIERRGCLCEDSDEEWIAQIPPLAGPNGAPMVFNHPHANN